MTGKGCFGSSIVSAWLLVTSLLFLTACSGTFEIGVVHTATPAAGDVNSATSTPTMEGAVPATSVPTPIPSPSALHVAFAKEHNVWLWHEGEEAVALTRAGGVAALKLSDDGQIVAFARGDELWMVRSDGTDERALVTLADFAAMESKEREFEVILHRFGWVPGTHVLAYNTQLRLEIGVVLNDDLHLVDADALERTILLPPGDGGEFYYSPDGRQVAVVTPGSISLVDADGGNRREAFTYTPIATASEFRYYARPVWAADSSSLQVAIPPVDPYTQPPQLTSVWRIHTDGTPASLLASVADTQMSWPAFSPDLRYVAYLYAEQLDPAASSYPESDLLITDLTLNATTIYYPQADTQITLDSGETVTHHPMAGEIYGWAPDSQHLAFLGQPDPQLPFQAQIGQLGGSVVPAYGDTDGTVIDVRWVDTNRYLFLAQSPKGWDILLGQIGGPIIPVAFMGGFVPPPAYDFAASVTFTPAPVEGGSGDGVIPFGLVYQTADGLYHVNADGESVRIFEPPDAIGYTRPTISPYGAQVLYEEVDDVWLADIATGERRNLTQTPNQAECCGQWWPNQPDAVLFSSWPPEGGGPSFGFPATIQLDGSQYRVLDDSQISYALPAPSPDGQTVAYDRGGRPWLYRSDTGPTPFDWTLYGLPSDQELRIVSPAWSPDGQRLAWVIGDCSTELCQVSIGLFDLQARTARFLHPYLPAGRGGQPPAPVWSPDGRWLAFVTWAVNSDEAGLWVTRADGQPEEEYPLAMGHARVTITWAWSPDGRWLAFSSTWQDGEIEHWVVEAGIWELHPLDLPSDAHIVGWVGSPG